MNQNEFMQSNVVWADVSNIALQDSTMYGFLDGPHGVFAGNFVVITDEIMDGFRNTGAAPGCFVLPFSFPKL